jgi:hypothetical protein
LSEIPQTHVDIAPTLLDIAGIPKENWPPFFDGRSLLPEWQSDKALDDGIEREIINVEYWGSATAPAGKWTSHYKHNSYKSLRMVSQNGKSGWLFNRWCTHDQTELYDTVADPYELVNLAINPNAETLRLMSRLSGLLLVTKSCGQDSCRKPWEVLSAAYHSTVHNNGLIPDGQVVIGVASFNTLDQAMGSRYDDFFATLPSFKFEMCLPYQLASNEGPFFPPESEDLGRRYRANTEDFSYYLTNSTLAAASTTGTFFGSAAQRDMMIADLYRTTRELTDDEIGRETQLCEAPDYCGQVDQTDDED